MNLGNFDKLKETIQQVVEKYRVLRFQNFKLEQENKTLKNRLQQAENLTKGMDTEKLEKLMAENKKLKSEKEEVKQRLNRLIAELEKLTN
jgi:FtsZ-binding cell division protein ZapB